MKKKFAYYCSGGASRILKFYTQNSSDKYPASFIYYDGNNKLVEEKLKDLFLDRIYTPISEIYFEKKTISEKLLYLLDIKKVDYLFCFGDKILRAPLIDIFKHRIINFHPSLLPAFPGLKSIDQALSTSVQLLGNTAHFIDKGVDSGKIIMQSVISRAAYKDYEDVLGLQIYMLKTIWDLLEADKISVVNEKVLIDCEGNNKPFFSL
jgi:phosphoribosylglycinamide formyltransferase 1